MKLAWPHVVVIGMILGAIVTLAAFDRDTTALVGLGTLLLAGLGLLAGHQMSIKDQTGVIKDQTNGNMSELLSLVREMAVRLADAPPPLRAVAEVGEPIRDANSDPPAPAE